MQCVSPSEIAYRSLLGRNSRSVDKARTIVLCPREGLSADTAVKKRSVVPARWLAVVLQLD